MAISRELADLLIGMQTTRRPIDEIELIKTLAHGALSPDQPDRLDLDHLTLATAAGPTLLTAARITREQFVPTDGARRASFDWTNLLLPDQRPTRVPIPVPARPRRH